MCMWCAGVLSMEIAELNKIATSADFTMLAL
jgi:hypothetical protein